MLFSCLVLTLWPYGLQHTRLPCPSLSPSSIQSLSRVWLFATPWTAQSLLRFMSIESMMLPNHLILCHHLLFPPLIFPSIRVFSSEAALRLRWPKYWSFTFSISPSNEYSGLISFRTVWLDLLAVQGTQESSLAQFESISFLALSPLYGPRLTYVHDYWKNHSFDSTDLCQQSEVFAF